MKHILIIFLAIFIFWNTASQKTINDCENVEFLEYVKKDTFDYWKIVEKKSINNDEFDLSRRIAIISKEAPEYQRIVYKKKSIYELPAYYLKKEADIIMTHQYSFHNLDKFIDKEIITDTRKYNSGLITTSKTEFSEKGWNILKFTSSNVRLLKLKMSIGFFNKNTQSMKLIGNYDEKIIVYHLIW